MSRDDSSSMPPIPSQALAYSIPTMTRRPGIITAIGVLCITIACLSALASFISGMYSVGFYFVSQMQATMGTAMTTSASTPAIAVPANAVTTAPTLPGGDAGVAVNAIDSMLKLDAAHIRELDRLMRRHGRDVFGGDDDTPITAATVRGAIISSKHRAAKAEFTTAQGTVEIFADHATFTSTDGSSVVRTSGLRNQDQITNTPTTGVSETKVSVYSTASAPPLPTLSATLTPAQINLAVGAAQGMATLNAAQSQTLRAELSKPNQTLVTAAAIAPIQGVVVQPNGNLAITFDTGNLLNLDAKGKVVSLGPPPMPNFGISGTLAAINAIEGLASIGLAIYLLIVGIIVLRGSFAAPRMLRIYAWIKIPLALIAGIGLTLLGYELANAILSSPAVGMGAPAAGSTKLGFAIAGAAAIIFGLAFPVGLILGLRSKAVSDYFNTVT